MSAAGSATYRPTASAFVITSMVCVYTSAAMSASLTRGPAVSIPNAGSSSTRGAGSSMVTGVVPRRSRFAAKYA